MNTISQEAYTGDIVTRLRNWRGLHLAHAGELFEEAADEIARLRLTDAERQAIRRAAAVADEFHDSRLGGTLRGLLERTKPDRLEAIERGESDRPQPIATPNPLSTPAECTVPPEWTSKPYWVDPPSGWRYGFPRLYDPAKDGDMRAWMIANGYPEHLANQGLACTFTAQTEGVG